MLKSVGGVEGFGMGIGMMWEEDEGKSMYMLYIKL